MLHGPRGALKANSIKSAREPRCVRAQVILLKGAHGLWQGFYFLGAVDGELDCQYRAGSLPVSIHRSHRSVMSRVSCLCIFDTKSYLLCCSLLSVSRIFPDLWSRSLKSVRIPAISLPCSSCAEPDCLYAVYDLFLYYLISNENKTVFPLHSNYLCIPGYQPYHFP